MIQPVTYWQSPAGKIHCHMAFRTKSSKTDCGIHIKYGWIKIPIETKLNEQELCSKCFVRVEA